jgi:hypothetical protein
MDPRDWFVFSFPRGFLHPDYEPLETLLDHMSGQLRGNHERSKDQSRKKPDYLHEAFQRLIIDFLFTHYDEPFMTKQKRPNHRKPKGVLAMQGTWSSHQIEQPGVSAARSTRLETSRNASSKSSLSVQSKFSLGSQSGSSRKRKRLDEDANISDLDEGDYELVSTV